MTPYEVSFASGLFQIYLDAPPELMTDLDCTWAGEGREGRAVLYAFNGDHLLAVAHFEVPPCTEADFDGGIYTEGFCEQRARQHKLVGDGFGVVGVTGFAAGEIPRVRGSRGNDEKW
jgi:hypothetical protein